MTEARAMDLKLGKLPDRSPIKMAIMLNPSLHSHLQAYAELYRQTYGVNEPLAELVPYMLASFIQSDRGFTRATRIRSTALPDD